MAETIVSHRDYADWSALQSALSEQYDSSVVNSLEPLQPRKRLFRFMEALRLPDKTLGDAPCL